MKLFLSRFMLIFLLGVPVISAAKCPPIDKYAFWLPESKKEHLSALLGKAKRLNDSGQCTLEGSFGSSSQKYYIAVSKSGKIKDAKNRFFTLAELRK